MNTTELISIGVAGLIISLGAFQAYTVLRKSEKKATRIIKHETWVNKTGKHENPRKGGTRRKRHT